MVRWRVLGVGVSVALVVETLVYILSGHLSLLGGLVGSALAGWLVDDGAGPSARYGFGVGVAWGVVLVPVAVYLTLATGSVALVPYDPLVPELGLAALFTAVGLGVTVPNALVGGLVGMLRARLSRHLE
ncbi:hypothetical protein SAMN04487950_1035 [Halogranum rubrum]|uniref:Uncharacterized protein n=1 Tax=Halogranum rubrum TaxID=553466 RepID=A0A1I4CB62_9EURY|nr:DUF5518 domain-containing protein [Halogranum rubrum]SFK77557.1 hypothetical protein SAMN04487950_1035 [Halogranum rubrum]